MFGRKKAITRLLGLPTWWGVAATSALHLSACAITRPCQEGGDIGWYPPIESSKKLCTQKQDKRTGKYYNHGLYREWHLNGSLALEGMFDRGEKHGIWQQYSENGKLVAEKYFEHGVEKGAPSQSSTEPDSSEKRKR